MNICEWVNGARCVIWYSPATHNYNDIQYENQMQYKGSFSVEKNWIELFHPMMIHLLLRDSLKKIQVFTLHNVQCAYILCIWRHILCSHLVCYDLSVVMPAGIVSKQFVIHWLYQVTHRASLTHLQAFINSDTFTKIYAANIRSVKYVVYSVTATKESVRVSVCVRISLVVSHISQELSGSILLAIAIQCGISQLLWSVLNISFWKSKGYFSVSDSK